MKKIIAFLVLFLSLITFSQINLENTTITETTIATNLEIPWDMTFGADGWIWFTEVSGKIKRLHPDTHELQDIFIIDDVENFGFAAGLHSIVLHPNFLITPELYVHYLNTTTTSKIVKYTYDDVNNTLINPIIILENIPGGVSHNGSRMFINNDLLFISLGDAYSNPNLAQDLTTIAGSILRMNLDGSVPDSNPISGSLIYSFGHRNVQGLCMGNGFIYGSEHGDQSNDEINLIQQNRNYGWPNVEAFCDTSSEIEFCNANNVKEPIWAWTNTTVAPCGMDFYDSNVIPEWQNSLLLATLRGKQLIQLKLNENGDQIIEENNYLISTYGRLRDILVIPDGRIFISTTNHDFFGNPIATDDRIIELKADNLASLNSNTQSLKVKIFPNPAKKEVNIKSNQFINSVKIFNIIGKLVMEKTFNNRNEVSINIQKLENGLYFIKTNNSSYLNKLIK